MLHSRLLIQLIRLQFFSSLGYQLQWPGLQAGSQLNQARVGVRAWLRVIEDSGEQP